MIPSKKRGPQSKTIKLGQKKPQKGNKSSDILKHFKGGKKERKRARETLTCKDTYQMGQDC